MKLSLALVPICVLQTSVAVAVEPARSEPEYSECLARLGPHPYLELRTDFGVIEIELYAEKAPITVCNFARYTNAGYFNGGRFFRVVRTTPPSRTDVPIAVIQAEVASSKNEEAFPPILLEDTPRTGIHHLDGTISMARNDEPISATSSFFLCIGEQPELDHGGKRSADGKGFAAFGKVRRGMDVVRRIHLQDSDNDERMVHPVAIQSARILTGPSRSVGL